MGSKSLSGSLIKSVKSMLPKNINMKHVLLAVLVGLLLCMLMGQSVEEGYSGKAGYSVVEGFNTLGAITTPYAPPPSGSGSATQPIRGADGSATGYCHAKNYERPTRQCLLDSVTGTVGAGGDEAKKAQAALICSRVTNSGCTGDTSKSSRDAAGAGSAWDSIKNELMQGSYPGLTDRDNIACKQGPILDYCAPMSNDSNVCDTNTAHSCEYVNCARTISAIGAKNDNELYTIDTNDVFETEYDHWRKCLFKNRLPEPRRGELTANETFGETTVGGDHPLSTGYIPKLKSGSTTLAHTTDAGAAMSPPVSLTDTDINSGVKVTGLIGWLEGGAGLARNLLQKDNPITPQVLRNMNAIPMDKDGKVPASLEPYLPPEWKQGFENMFDYCKKGTDDEGAIIGWSSDFRSLKCLNYNPNLSTTCVTKPVCKYKKQCGNNDINEDGELTAGAAAHIGATDFTGIINSDCGPLAKVGSLFSAAYDEVNCLPNKGVDAISQFGAAGASLLERDDE